MNRTEILFESRALDPQQTCHDLSHLMLVADFARRLAAAQNTAPEMMERIEAAAILHDIACPVLRTQYGRASGKKQEEYGPGMAEPLLIKAGFDRQERDRICFLIGMHHSPEKIDGTDAQILLEADALVNTIEGGWSRQAADAYARRWFATAQGRRMMENILHKNS